MKEFLTDKKALDFIAESIAAEAQRQGTPLSAVERKMLDFSETNWTLPDMAEVNAEFENDYLDVEYEHRVARLIAGLVAGFKDDPAAKQTWDAAIEKLSEGDRYLLVMVRMAGATGHRPGGGFLPTLDRPTVRPPHDILKLLAAGFVICIAGFGFGLLCQKLPPKDWRIDHWLSHYGLVIWLIVIIAVLCYPYLLKLKFAFTIWLDRRKLPPE